MVAACIVAQYFIQQYYILGFSLCDLTFEGKLTGIFIEYLHKGCEVVLDGLGDHDRTTGKIEPQVFLFQSVKISLKQI